MLIQPFASQVNFLDPKYNQKGEPYGPYRFQQIIKESYYISKNCNTSYNDVLKMTPTERDSILAIIIQEGKETEKVLNELQEKNNRE